MNSYRQGIALRLLLPLLPLLSACGLSPVNPEGFTGQVGGCGNFFVYKFNEKMTESVVVSATARDLVFDRTPRDFILPNPALDVRIERFAAPAHSYYCDDVAGDADPYHIWKAVSGTVRISSGDTVNVPEPWEVMYKVNVSLQNITFRDKDGDEVTIRELDYGEISVGWLPG